MSKNSRKVRGWGGLGDYTEHRTKDGRVSSRTRYHEGKAITTRAPKEPAYTKPGYRAPSSSPGMLDGALSGILIVIAVLVLIGAGIGAVLTALNSALEGFWPIARIVLSWILAVGWAGTVLHAILVAVERFSYPSWLTWVLTGLQLPIIAAGGYLAFALVAVPSETPESSEQISILNIALGIGIPLLPLILGASIASAIRHSWKWILLVPIGLVVFFVLTIAGLPYLGSIGTLLVGYILMMTRFSIVED